MTKDEQGREIIRCDYHIHAKLSADRRFLSERCTDGRCPDAVVAKERGLWCIHHWDLWTPVTEPELRRWTEFEQPPTR